MRPFLYVLVIFLSTSPLLASSAGQTGRTSATSGGCGGGGCHGGSASTATTLRVPQAVAGVITVEPGSTTTITIIVAHSSRPATGINIGVKSTATGSTAVGTLATAAGQGLRFVMSVGDLTHTGPKTITDGEASFTFSWTAPTQAGTYFLRAIANAVNRDGSSGSGDQWNWMTPVQIVVSPANSVSEYSAVDVSVSPVPAHESVSMTVPTAPGERLRIAVIDQQGSMISTDDQTATGESFRYVWNGRTLDGSLAPQGAYVVTIMSDRRLMKGRAIIIR